MDGKRFDDLSRRFAIRQSRRGFLGLIGGVATGALTQQATSGAPKQDKPTKCYGQGSHCTNGKQCCSNTCTNRQCTADVGPGPECGVASDCPGTDSECQVRTCIGGVCGVTNTPDGFPVSDQIAGDCQMRVCDGFGGVVSTIDDSDTPLDPNDGDCTLGICVDGVPGTAPAEMYRPCDADGGFICDGAGQCVVCIPGDIQSCYSGPGGTEGVGVCRAGTMTCLADGSGYGECSGEVLPSPEQCNLLDDDCDGMVDEGVLEVGNICTVPVPDWLPGNCEQGTVHCLNGELHCCSTLCSDLGGGPLCA